MRIKKIALILFITLLCLAVLKAKKIKKYFVEERYHPVLMKLGITKKCYTPYSMDIESVFAQEGLNFEEMDQKVTLASINKLKDPSIQAADTPKIQTNTHHVYFTSSTKPIKLLDFYVEKIKANFRRLETAYPDWQHYIWTNNKEIFPAEIRNLPNVKVKDITEFKDHGLYNYLSATIKKGDDMRAYFMEASDMLRLMVLQKFGGIYQDIDYEIYNAEELFELMKKFDFIGGREFPGIISYYGNSFMSAKLNHPIINEAVNRLELYHNDPKNIKIPDYIKYPCAFLEKLYLNSPPLLTIAYFKKNNIDNNNDIILPFWMIFNANFARDKNGGCEYNKFSKLDFHDDEKLKNLIQDFAKNPVSSYFNLGEEEKHPRDDIYYNIEKRKGFNIIGADMFCGTWSRDVYSTKYYYWNWPFNLILKSDEQK